MPAKGAVAGAIRLAGTQVPETILIENSTDPEICGLTHSRRDLLLSPENRGIANVIVSLADVPPDDLPQPRPDRIVIDNVDCQFVPHVVAVTVGSTIQTVSHDKALHTVHFYGALERNVALANASASMSVTADTPGMIAVLCDVHGWMRAFIRVDTHPFHAVTDSRGTFVIPDIPVGSYALEVWHERLGSQVVSVDIEAGATREVDIFFELGEH